MSIAQRQVHLYGDLLSLTLYILLAGIMVGMRKMRDRYGHQNSGINATHFLPSRCH